MSPLKWPLIFTLYVGKRGDLLHLSACWMCVHVCVQESLEQIQSVLNSTEVGLHQLTALVDCRSLHMVSHCGFCLLIKWSLKVQPDISPLLVRKDYVQALTGLCYDGVEGLIYLVLFSFITALMFSSIVCSVPHTWPRKRYPACTAVVFVVHVFPLHNVAQLIYQTWGPCLLRESEFIL